MKSKTKKIIKQVAVWVVIIALLASMFSGIIFLFV